MTEMTLTRTQSSLNDAPQFIDLGASEIAYWKVGRGDPLLLVHGYPVSGRTWRHVVRRLAEHFTCYVVDLPGAGETRWTEATDFRFGAQALTLRAFVERLHLTSYFLMGHDTGGTIARRLATLDAPNVRKLVLVGTEIPNHRPPWIELFQKITDPKQPKIMQFLLGQRWFRRSGMGFGGCFQDKSLIDGEFKQLFVDPVLADSRRVSGLQHYLLGIDWAVVDGMAEEHRRLTMPTLLIWGENDPVFPVADARIIADQLPDCRGFFVVPDAKLFVHEEKPDEVARLAADFLSAAQ